MTQEEELKKEKNREYCHKWREANKEHLKEYQKKWRDEHADDVKTYHSNWRKSHKSEWNKIVKDSRDRKKLKNKENNSK